MKITLINNGVEVMTYDATAIPADAFAEAIKQATMQLISKWLAGDIKLDHKISINQS